MGSTCFTEAGIPGIALLPLVLFFRALRLDALRLAFRPVWLDLAAREPQLRTTGAACCPHHRLGSENNGHATHHAQHSLIASFPSLPHP